MRNIQKTNGAQNSFVKTVFDNIVLCSLPQLNRVARRGLTVEGNTI